MKNIETLSSETLLGLIKSEMLLTVGCTDPAAIALGAAAAGSVQNGRSIEKIKIYLDKNILKNAQSVIIPGTGKSGIPLAAALGVVKGNIDEGVLIFNHLNTGHIEEAENIIKKIPIDIQCKSGVDHIYIEVTLFFKQNQSTTSLIEFRHDNLISIQDNGVSIFRNQDLSRPGQFEKPVYTVPRIQTLIELVRSLSDDDLQFLSSARDTNTLVADAGLNLNPGAGIGRWLKDLYENNDSDGWPSKIMRSRYKVAAATDSRMGGIDIPVMACGGSGNHGLTFFITLNETVSGSDYNKCAALGMGILHFIKEATGILTPMCGCAMAAGMAASAAITYSRGGDEKAILRSMNFVLGFLGGIVCEGAKKECSLKTSLSSQVAIESSLLAMDLCRIDSGAGLFSDSFKGLLNNLESVHKKGMKGFDEVMVEILLRKEYKKDNCI